MEPVVLCSPVRLAALGSPASPWWSKGKNKLHRPEGMGAVLALCKRVTARPQRHVGVVRLLTDLPEVAELEVGGDPPVPAPWN